VIATFRLSSLSLLLSPLYEQLRVIFSTYLISIIPITAMKVILYQPQIPQNTGNVVRSCSVTGSALALVPPLGFSLSDRWLKRAGLDYWEGVDVEVVKGDFIDYLAQAPGAVYFFSSKGKVCYSDISYNPCDWLVFGSETSGLPSELVSRYASNVARIPMKAGARCLNLATSVGIVLFEAYRQGGFAGMDMNINTTEV
jgi:tRNA (cytidine/uridine-2'-O-)-methyltransferase